MKRKEKRKLRIEEKVTEVIDAYRSAGAHTDPNGMYTGNTEEIQHSCPQGKIYMNVQNTVPTQDADDL